MNSLSNTLASLAPHGFCLAWRPDLLWLHVVSDAATALAYYTIPVMLLVLVRRRKDLQFSWVFVLFGVFIMACGATHVMSLWTLWFPDYLAAGLVKAVTALASVATAATLVPLVPKAVALPGPAQWRAVNDDLQRQVDERQRAEDEVRRLNGELEQRVMARTAELQESNRRLTALHEELEQRVRDRTRDLEKAQGDLVASARQAGMAEIATNVLHNVGNVLNSVNVSAELVTQGLRNSKLPGLAKASEMLQAQGADVGRFIADDPKGQRLPGYLALLSQTLSEEQRGLLVEMEQMGRSIDHIKDIVATQQAYAGGHSLAQPTDVPSLLDDALRMNAVSLSRHHIVIERDIEPMPELMLDRHRILQILVNLVTNAKQAMNAPGAAGQRLLLRARLGQGGRLLLSVQDEGDGISAENQAKIFAHGFTTRAEGHGFGLHSCIVAAREMGGDLRVESAGPGSGATFTLDLPARTADDVAPADEAEPALT